MQSRSFYHFISGVCLVIHALGGFELLQAADEPPKGNGAAEVSETWAGTAQITFDGTSTLHDWTGKVSAEPFKTEVILKDGKPRRIKSKVLVKAAAMDTDEAKRDENMRKAMKVSDHPLIIGSIDTEFSDISPAGTPVKLPLSISLLGRQQSISSTISNWKSDGRRASFDLDFPISMKASGISVPPVLFFIRVGDGVKVHASVELRKN